ncbi:MAG: hypothetical protein MJZ29_05050 [Bacteroidaceae bacterium]|nr:hypothetical protein [Bacteroidaceae bacterium]
MKKKYKTPKFSVIAVYTTTLLATSQESIVIGGGSGDEAGAKRFHQLIFDDSDDFDVE